VSCDEVLLDKVSEVRYGEIVVDKSAIDVILRVLDLILRVLDLILMVLYYIVTISFGYILSFVYFHYCGCFKLFCNVCVCVCLCVCVGACICVCFGNLCTSTLGYPD